MLKCLIGANEVATYEAECLCAYYAVMSHNVGVFECVGLCGAR